MKNSELLELADLNFSEFNREMARWNLDSEIIEKNDILLIAGPEESPVTNYSIRLSYGPYPSGELFMEAVEKYFGDKKRGYSIFIREHADEDLKKLCRSYNMILISEAPGMVVERTVSAISLPDGIRIAEVNDAQGARDFAEVAIESYQSLGMKAEVGREIFKTPERMLKPSNLFVIAYDKERPVSCAMCMFSHSISGVYWVGTVKEYRNKGLAEACTAEVTNKSFEKGAKRVILQASKMGEPIYRRMGYRDFTRYPWYMRF